MREHVEHHQDGRITIAYDDLAPVEEDRYGDPVGPFRWVVRRRGHLLGETTTIEEARALAGVAPAALDSGA